MKRTVTVLQDDIDNGVRESAERCAVARAVRRDLADFSYVSVGPDHLYLDHDNAPTPLEVALFVHRFDNGFPVEPFKFEIEVPDQ